MSKIISRKVKRMMVTLLVATSAVGTISPMNQLYAATDSISINQGENSVKVKDTTLTFNGFKQGEHGVINTEVVLERASGIPENVNEIWIVGEGIVTINGTKYSLDLSFSKKVERISDTRLKADIKTRVSKKEGKTIKQVTEATAEKLKGQKIEFTIEEVGYYVEKSTIDPQFLEALKNVTNVQGVEPKNAGFAELEGDPNHKSIFDGMKVLPPKGLNIPIIQGENNVIDNIGFVNGQLQLRTVEKGECCNIQFIDSKGQKVPLSACGGVGDTGCSIFDIKDAETLQTLTPKVSMQKRIITDEETKKAIFTF